MPRGAFARDDPTTKKKGGNAKDGWDILDEFDDEDMEDRKMPTWILSEWILRRPVGELGGGPLRLNPGRLVSSELSRRIAAAVDRMAAAPPPTPRSILRRSSCDATETPTTTERRGLRVRFCKQVVSGSQEPPVEEQSPEAPVAQPLSDPGAQSARDTQDLVSAGENDAAAASGSAAEPSSPPSAAAKVTPSRRPLSTDETPSAMPLSADTVAPAPPAAVAVVVVASRPRTDAAPTTPRSTAATQPSKPAQAPVAEESTPWSRMSVGKGKESSTWSTPCAADWHGVSAYYEDSSTWTPSSMEEWNRTSYKYKDESTSSWSTTTSGSEWRDTTSNKDTRQWSPSSSSSKRAWVRSSNKENSSWQPSQFHSGRYYY